MDAKDLQELKDHITHHTDISVGKSIEIHVNGKIRALTDRFDAYVKEDTKWKEEAQPAIELGKNIKSFGIVTISILGAIAAFGAAFSVIKDYIPHK